MSKVCKRCHEEKPLRSYRRIKDERGRPVHKNTCKNCERKFGKPNTADFRRVLLYEKSSIATVPDNVPVHIWRAAMSSRTRSLLEHFQFWLMNKKNWCKAGGVRFDLTAQDLLEIYMAQNGLCALTGRILVWGTRTAERDALSFDRINPLAGYVPANIRLTTLQANMARNKWSDHDLVEFAKAVIRYRAAIEALPKPALSIPRPLR